ncbi:hypothetical protein HT094_22365 [Shewanella sp. ZOR0012]|uniref:hypothetical protein n=1 Tax=Shewanella sp. ZOR0012 TaxID=1339231 RepID=UPI0006474240|nr:hypothetical protein [Shewanella sp. ZOR0012]NSM26847.1 hypothetical protein [Shewanella sp. ZOR0012]
MDNKVISFFILLVFSGVMTGLLVVYEAEKDAEDAKKEAEYLANFPYTLKGLGAFPVEFYLTEDKVIQTMSPHCMTQSVGTKITLLENKNIIQIDSTQLAIKLGCPARFFLAKNLADTFPAYSKAFSAAANENDPSLEFSPVN